MREAGGVVLGLLGAWLLWKVYGFARVLLLVDAMPGEGTAIAVMAVLAAISAIMLFFAWRLLRTRRI